MREKEARSFEGTQKEETDVKSPKTEKRGLMGKMRNALQALRKAREVDRRMERWDEDIEMRRYMAGLEGTDQMPGETSHEQDGERREGPVILVITSPSTSELNKACQCQSDSKLTRKEKKERRKLQKRQSEELRKQKKKEEEKKKKEEKKKTTKEKTTERKSFWRKFLCC
ncbi:protein PXR1-like [Colossoma macropomum]|uniref:protein PXR1-like n=1 Tax=Colossoma macropomum TaxID=42526 RepID=UPI001864988A|nr:protein PXR1-like [Colossoma macropomum]